MVRISPFDIIVWALRRKESDVVNMYSHLAPIMQIATSGGMMLNFGYWNDGNTEPISAQRNLCRYFARMAELKSAIKAVDVGSGLAAPAGLWKDDFERLAIYCVNTNYAQLHHPGSRPGIEFVNSSATKLPFADGSVDRVLALESAQHFRPFPDFVSEAKRILCDGGLLVMAIPIATGAASISRLGILKFTWMSEHYNPEQIHKVIRDYGFVVCEEQMIGSYVYEPLADHYIQNRDTIRELISKDYPRYVEEILYRSIQKMRQASEDKTIEYLLLKCSRR